MGRWATVWSCFFDTIVVKAGNERFNQFFTGESQARGEMKKGNGRLARIAAWALGAIKAPGKNRSRRARSLGAPLPSGFWLIEPAQERALAAREHAPTQAFFWRCAAQALAQPFEQARSVFWLKTERPGWFQSEPEWRQSRLEIAERAAALGWIHPSMRLAQTLGRPEKSESLAMLGGLFDQPWPAQARYCDTLSLMAHRLFESDLGARLCGLSEAGLARAELMSEGFDLIAPGAPSRGKRL